MRLCKLSVLLVLASILSCGCFHNSHKAGLSDRQIEPARIRSLKQFEGTFSAVPRGSGPNLSLIIFRNSAPTNSDASSMIVDEVSSKVLDDSHLHIQALSKGKIVKEATLILDKDFKISSSRIPIKSDFKSAATKGGDGYTPPFTGVAKMSGDIFINKDGDLIYHSSTEAAILMLYVVPMAGSVNNYGIYKRLK
jgi:hypothetical protein